MNRFRKLFHAFFHFNIGAFVKFLQGFLCTINQLSPGKKLSTGIYSPRPMSLFTLLPVKQHGCDGLEISKFVGQFTSIKWNVSHNLVQMTTIVNYCNCMHVVLFVFFLIKINVISSEIFVYDDFFLEKVQNSIQWTLPYSGHFFQELQVSTIERFDRIAIKVDMVTAIAPCFCSLS